MLNLATVIETNARLYPERIALVSGPVRMTHYELNQAANQVAHALRAAGIGRNDKVAIACITSQFFPICYYGILKVGAVVVPLNILLKAHDVRYHLSDSNALAFFCSEGTDDLPIGTEGWNGFQGAPECRHFWTIPSSLDGKPGDIARELKAKGATDFIDLVKGQPLEFDTVQTEADDTCGIIYTSGTTGPAKGAELSNMNLVMNCQVFGDIMGYCRDDVVLIPVQMYHALGQTLLMGAAWYSGATLVLLPRFDPNTVLQTMQEQRISVFCGVPTMYFGLLDCAVRGGFDLGKISAHWRAGICGGAPVPPELIKRVKEVFGVRILIGYGLSETTAAACTTRYDVTCKRGSVGLPLWGVEMRVVDETMRDVPVGARGEIVVRGHNVMKGYYGKPDLNTEVFRGGWFHTGDIGTRDSDGEFYVVDRIKDMILRGGHNISPSEVEAILVTHPDVAMTSVVGIPDERLGEEIRAYVVLRDGAELQPESLVAWSREAMASHTYPRQIVFRKQLPVGPTGKILKTELREETI